MAFPLGGNAAAKNLLRPCVGSERRGSWSWGALQWICKREKNEGAEIRVLWSLLRRIASLYTETKGKSADGAGGRILKPSDETEFSGYLRQQEGGEQKAPNLIHCNRISPLSALKARPVSMQAEQKKKNQYMVYIDINVQH